MLLTRRLIKVSGISGLGVGSIKLVHVCTYIVVLQMLYIPDVVDKLVWELIILRWFEMLYLAARGGAQSGRGRGGGARGRGRGGVGQHHNQALGNYAGPSIAPIIGNDSANSVPVGQMYGGRASFLLPTPQFSGSHPTQGSRGSFSGGHPYSNTTPRYGPQGVGTSYGGVAESDGGATGRGGSWKQGQGASIRGRGKKKSRGRGRDDYGFANEPASQMSRYSNYTEVRGGGVVLLCFYISLLT